jgi:hypothetical protein
VFLECAACHIQGLAQEARRDEAVVAALIFAGTHAVPNLFSLPVLTLVVGLV